MSEGLPQLVILWFLSASTEHLYLFLLVFTSAHGDGPKG